MRINDDGSDFQVVPSESRDVHVIMEPLAVGEGRFIMSLGINTDLHQELSKTESEIMLLLAQKHPGVIWQSALRPADEAMGAALKVRFYDDLQVYNESGESTAAPKFWRSTRVVPILNLKVWVSDKGAGVWWTMAAVKVSKPEPRTYTFV